MPASHWLTPRQGFLLVLFTALLARALVLSQSVDSVFHAAPTLDALTNWITAQSWAFGDGPSRPFFKAPLYPWALGQMIVPLGSFAGGERDTLSLLLFMQSALGIVTALLVWQAGRMGGGETAGVIAGCTFALCGAAIHYESEILDTTLVMFLMAAGVVCLMRPECSIWRLLLGGALWGLAAITRPTALGPFGLLLILTVALPPAPIPQRITRGLAALVPVVIIIGIVAWANGFQAPIATYGGPNLWLANRPGADGFTTRVPQMHGATRAGEDYIERFAVDEASLILGHEVYPSDADRYWRNRALRFWAMHPLDALAMTSRRVGLFWQGDQIRNNRSLVFAGEQIPALGWLLRLVSWRWIAPLGLIGLWMGLTAESASRRFATLAALACVVGFFLASLPFPITTRYRLPALPFLCVGAGLFGPCLITRARTKRRAAAGAIAAWTVGLLVFTGFDWTGGADERERWRDWWQLGNLALERADEDRGDFELAEHAYREALRLQPDHFESQVNLARLLILRGDREKALTRLRRLRWDAPENPVLPTMMGQILLLEGQPRQAERLLREALRIDPAHFPAMASLAQALWDLERPAEAGEWAEQALEDGDAGWQLWLLLFETRQASGDESGAAEALQRALILNPELPAPEGS